MRPAEPPSLLYTVKQVELVSRARLDRLLRTAGITALQYTALTVLERRPAMTAADLARTSFVSAQSAQELVDALRRRGLIDRTVDPDHRRRRLISLTDAGRDLLAQCTPQVEILEQDMLADFDEEDRRLFRSMLLACRRNLVTPQD